MSDEIVSGTVSGPWRGVPCFVQPPPDQAAVTALVPPIPAPRLAGFVLRDEDNETAQALVAIRFEGRVWLVGEGELVGSERQVAGWYS